MEKNEFSRLTPCMDLATKDFYSCDTEAGQVYVFANVAIAIFAATITSPSSKLATISGTVKGPNIAIPVCFSL